MKTYEIAVVHGDGIGPEVCQAALDVVHAAFGNTQVLRFVEYGAGAEQYQRTGIAYPKEAFDGCHRFANIAWSRGRGSWLRSPSQIQHLKKAHSFAVSSGSHALRTYTDDAGVPLAAAGRTFRGHAARTACVCRCLWGHLKMRGFVRRRRTILPSGGKADYFNNGQC